MMVLRCVAVVVWSMALGSCPVAYQPEIHIYLLQGQAYT